MGFVTITKDQARHAHASHYTKPFEVIRMTRSGPWDFPPYSWVYGISDFGSWEGLISTDGEKVVVTRSNFLDLSSTKATYEFKVSDIEDIKFGIFKTTIKLKHKIPGLTKGTILRTFLVLPGIFIYLIPFFIALLMPQKIFQARLKDEFGNINDFQKLISK